MKTLLHPSPIGWRSVEFLAVLASTFLGLGVEYLRTSCDPSQFALKPAGTLFFRFPYFTVLWRCNLENVLVQAPWQIAVPSDPLTKFRCPTETRGIVLCVFDAQTEADDPTVPLCMNAFLQSELAVLTVRRSKSALDTAAEDQDNALCRSLSDSLQWLMCEQATAALPLGVWTNANCAVPALAFAAQHCDLIDAVVCRGGHPHSAPTRVLDNLRAPTLFVKDFGDDSPPAAPAHVAGLRPRVLRTEYIRRIPDDRGLASSHERIADLSVRWMLRYLIDPPVWSFLGKK